MNKFLNTQAGRAKSVLNETFLRSKPEKKEVIKPASTEPVAPEESTTASQERTPFVRKLFNSFRRKSSNSRVDGVAKNESPSLPDQPVEKPDEEANQKSGKLNYLQAQFKKYTCSFKSRIYSGQNQTLMSEEEEAKANKLTIELFACLVLFLAPALREFLTSKNLHPKNSTVDGYEYLKKMLKICKRNINFLSPGGGNGLDLKYVETAHKGRNSVCHGILPVILAEWHQFLHSWIEVCYLINAPDAAKEIQLVHDRLVAEEERNREPIPAEATNENTPELEPLQDDKGQQPETQGKV